MRNKSTDERSEKTKTRIRDEAKGKEEEREKGWREVRKRRP